MGIYRLGFVISIQYSSGFKYPYEYPCNDPAFSEPKSMEFFFVWFWMFFNISLYKIIIVFHSLTRHNPRKIM